MGFQVTDRSYVYTALGRICGEKLRLQVHQLDLVISVLIDDDFGFEIFGQVQEYFLFAQVVREKKHAVL